MGSGSRLTAWRDHKEGGPMSTDAIVVQGLTAGVDPSEPHVIAQVALQPARNYVILAKGDVSASGWLEARFELLAVTAVDHCSIYLQSYGTAGDGLLINTTFCLSVATTVPDDANFAYAASLSVSGAGPALADKQPGTGIENLSLMAIALDSLSVSG